MKQKWYNLMPLVLLIFSFSIVSKAEIISPRKISLKDAVKLAKESNYDVKLASTEIDKMQSEQNKTLSAFLPQITISETFTKTNDPLNVFGFKLKQEVVTASDFNPVLLNSPDEFDNYTTKVSIMQPLVNLDGFYARGAAHNGVKAVEQQKIRTEHYIEFQVKQNYFQLVLARESLKVITQALNVAKLNRDQAQNYYKEDIINKADFLQAEVRVAELESKKVEIENNVEHANNNLKFLLGLDDTTIFEPEDSLLYKNVHIQENYLQDINLNRSDMQALRYNIQALEKTVKMNSLKFVPRLNGFASYELNDKNTFGNHGKSWMVGAMLKWDIFNGFKNIGEIQKSKAQLNNVKVTLEKTSHKNKVDLDSALRNLESMKKRIQLAENAVEQSDERLRIMTDRFKNGLEKTTDVLNAEVSAANSQLDYLNTVYHYNLSIFQIELLTEKAISNS